MWYWRVISYIPNISVIYLISSINFNHMPMGSLKSLFGFMRSKVTEFQCLYLELYALLDYLEIYKPCMDGHQPPATTVTNCIGAFTNMPHITQYFHRAGLHIWFLQPGKTGPFPYNALSVISPLDPTDSLCFSAWPPPFLWYSVATWTLKRDTMPSSPTHENGWFSKICFIMSHHRKIQKPKDTYT